MRARERRAARARARELAGVVAAVGAPRGVQRRRPAPRRRSRAPARAGSARAAGPRRARPSRPARASSCASSVGRIQQDTRSRVSERCVDELRRDVVAARVVPARRDVAIDARTARAAATRRSGRAASPLSIAAGPTSTRVGALPRIDRVAPTRSRAASSVVPTLPASSASQYASIAAGSGAALRGDAGLDRQQHVRREVREQRAAIEAVVRRVGLRAGAAAARQHAASASDEQDERGRGTSTRCILCDLKTTFNSDFRISQ